MSYHHVIRNIRNGQLQPVYVVTGEELFFRDSFLEALHTSFSQADEVDENQFDLQEDSLHAVLDEAESFSFFTDHRLIIVHNPDFLGSGRGKDKTQESEVNRLLDYLDNPNEGSTVVFIYQGGALDNRRKLTKTIKKHSYLVELPQLNEQEMSRFVREHIEQQPFNMSQEAVEELLDRVNFQLTPAMNELEKLKMYAVNQNQISKDIVTELVPRALASDVFQLTQAIMDKRLADAVQIYEDLTLLGHEPIALHALIISQFRIILQSLILASQGFREGDIASHLNVHPYRVKLALKNSRHIQGDALTKLYIELADIDYQLKSGYGSRDSHFYVLLTRIQEL